MRNCIVGLAALIGLVGAGRVDAAIVFTGIDVGAGPSDPRPNSDAAAASFDAATLVDVLDFEDLSVGSFTSMEVAPGVTANLSGQFPSTSGITDGTNFGVTPDNIVGYNTTALGEKFLLFTPQPSSNVTTASVSFVFDTPIQAWGAYITGLGTSTGDMIISYGDGSTTKEFSVAGDQQGGVLFFGFTEAGAAFTSVTLELRNEDGNMFDRFGVDDVRYGVIPEPSTLIVWSLLGALGICFGWWRRKRSAP